MTTPQAGTAGTAAQDSSARLLERLHRRRNAAAGVALEAMQAGCRDHEVQQALREHGRSEHGAVELRSLQLAMQHDAGAGGCW